MVGLSAILINVQEIYCLPSPPQWDVGQQKDILRWLSQQKTILLSQSYKHKFAGKIFFVDFMIFHDFNKSIVFSAIMFIGMTPP